MAETCIQLRDKSILFFLPLSTNSCVHQLNTVSPQHWHAATLWALSEWDKKHKCATELSWETKQHRYKGCLPHYTQSLNPMLILKYRTFIFIHRDVQKCWTKDPDFHFYFYFFASFLVFFQSFFFRHWLLFNKFTVNIVDFFFIIKLLNIDLSLIQASKSYLTKGINLCCL